MKSGDRVNWTYEPRGGYGYTCSIAGVVRKVNPKMVRIAVYTLQSAEIEEKNVTPGRLTPRTSHSILDDKLAKKEQSA